jgi:hypothetical protein
MESLFLRHPPPPAVIKNDPVHDPCVVTTPSRADTSIEMQSVNTYIHRHFRDTRPEEKTDATRRVRLYRHKPADDVNHFIDLHFRPNKD